jgi:PAS domain S-box-containing protein
MRFTPYASLRQAMRASRTFPPEARELLWSTVWMVLGSGLVVVLALAYSRHQTQLVAERSIASQAHIVQEQAERTLQTLDQRLQLVSHYLAQLEAGQTLTPLSAKELLREQLKELPFVRAMWVMDAQGRVAYDTNSDFVGVDLSARAYFQIYQTQPQTQFFLGAPVKSTKGEWDISVARPLPSRDGAFAGIVVAALNPHYFDQVWGDLVLGPQATVSLFRADSVLVISSPFLEDAIGKAFPSLPFSSPPVGAEQAGKFEMRSPIDGIERHMAYRSLIHYPAVVVVGSSRQDIYTFWTKLASFMFVFWLATLLGVLLLRFSQARAVALRLQTETALRESDQQLHRTLSNGSLGLWDWDATTDKLIVNARWFTMLGLDPHGPQPTLATWHALVHPEDMQLLNRLKETVIFNPAQKDFEVEVRARHSAGHWVWIHDKGSVVSYTTDGRPLRVVGIHMDISARRRMEEALRQSEYRWRFAIEGSGDGLWDWDMVARTVFYSESWKSMLGFVPGEISNHPDEWATRLHPEDKARVKDALRLYIEGKTSHYEAEFRMVCKDGSSKWMRGRGTVVVRDAQGKPLRMIGFNTDLTERRRTDEVIRAGHAQLQLLDACIARLNDMVLITEAEPFDEPGNRIVFVNDAFVRRTGYSREEVIGKSPRFLQGPKTQRADLDRIGAALRRWEPVRAELINYTKHGEEFWLEIDIVPIADASGWFTHWVSVERDITERKRAQEALQSSLDEKVGLLNEVHHRVKNNLQVITSLLRLEIRRSDVAGTQHVLNDMQGRVRSMALLHESLYRTGTFASVDLSDYLKKLCQQVFRSNAQPNDLVKLVMDVASVRVTLDQATPCALLANELLSNCLKHGFPDGRSGEVRVSLQCVDAHHWRLQVSDNGVGLPADLEQRRGSSLGLQLVSDLALQLGGKLEIGPGPGAMFTVVVVLANKT